ncbi:uncharacterized protein [Periplaneta americana]|uniref:uncharacterized protein isoform X2 n=1 Tax=Periplaneta americana TaxID=6978 RepID=UPI0037E79909
MMRRASLLEDTTSSSNVSGLLSRYNSDEDIDKIAAIHPATRASVRSSSQVYASTPLPGVKVNLAMVGSWPSPVRADNSYSLRQNSPNKMKQMKGNKVQDSLEVKQSPLRRRSINLSELMASSDEETEEPHHSTALKVYDADRLEGAVKTRSHIHETGSVVNRNKKRRVPTLTEAKLEEVHNRRESNNTRKSPKKMVTTDWDSISIDKRSGHALRNLQPRLHMKTINKKEVTFHLPNDNKANESPPAERSMGTSQRNTRKTEEKNKKILVDSPIKSSKKAAPKAIRKRKLSSEKPDGNKTNESPPVERGKRISQGNIRKTEEKTKKSLVGSPIKSSKKASPKTIRKTKPASENKPDSIQSSGSETLQDHENVTGKRKKMSPKEIRQNSPRSSRKSGTDNEDGVRRSKRKRVRRLEYWRGERIEYKVGIDNCREVVGISAGNPDFGQSVRRYKARRKHIITDLLDRDQDFRRNLIPMSHGSSPQMCECFSTFRIESETVESDMPILTGLEAPGMSAGIMSIEPSFVVNDLVNDEFNLVSFIMSGTVTVKIKKMKRTLRKSEIFFVPKGIHYSISNMSRNEAVIGYTLYE